MYTRIYLFLHSFIYVLINIHFNLPFSIWQERCLAVNSWDSWDILYIYIYYYSFTYSFIHLFTFIHSFIHSFVYSHKKGLNIVDDTFASSPATTFGWEVCYIKRIITFEMLHTPPYVIYQFAPATYCRG